MIYERVDIMSGLATQTKCKQLNHMTMVIKHLLSHAMHAITSRVEGVWQTVTANLKPDHRQ